MRRAYTLVEMLVTVVVLGTAAAMVIPTFASMDVLRVQGAIRMIVSDLTVQQSDAIAFQAGRAVQFVNDNSNPRYIMADVVGGTLDTTSSFAVERRFGGDEMGHCQIEAMDFPSDAVIFDELGSPVMTPGSDVPAPASGITIIGSGQRFRINVEAYTGRVTVQALPVNPGPDP